MVLVVYVCLRYTYACAYDRMRTDDVEASAREHQRASGIPDAPFHEKYGYLEVRSRPLRTPVVEAWMDHADSVCAGLLPVLRPSGKCDRNCRRDFVPDSVRRSCRIDFSDRKGAEEEFYRRRSTEMNPRSFLIF